jgi:hypothetical protein
VSGPRDDLTALPYVRVAGLITSGPAGFELFEALCAEFPDIGRRDLFLGIATAVALLQADLLVSALDAQQLRQQVDRRVAA